MIVRGFVILLAVALVAFTGLKVWEAASWLG